MSSGPSRTGVGSLPGVLTLMALLRAVALALPTMHLWGLNAARFLPPWLRWTPLVISVATLHPAIGRLAFPDSNGCRAGGRSSFRSSRSRSGS